MATAAETVPTIDTPRHSSNNGEDAHSYGSGTFSSTSVQYFSKHDTVELGEHNFLLWKHQLLLILEGYGLEGFVLGTVSTPPPFVTGIDGQLVDNPAFLVHKRQDKFLASWLLSTVTDDILAHLTMAKTSLQIWTAIDRRFGTKFNIKISNMRHSLYSIKKGSLSIKEYLFKIKQLSDGLTAAGSLVSTHEQVSIILAGLPIEYDSIRVLASATSVSLDLLVEMLLDCETRQMVSLTETPLQANLASRSPPANTDKSGHYLSFNRGHRGQGRGWSRGRARGSGRGWSRSRPQCQLCGKMGHMVQTCYHQFDENFSGVGSVQVNCHQLHGQWVPSSSTSCPSATHCCGPTISSQPTSQSSLSTSLDQAWYPDSGTTNHINPDLSNLTAASPYTGTACVSMGNGKLVSISNVGSSVLQTGSRLLCLRSVLYVLNTWTTLLVGHMHNGLYRFDVSHAAPSKTSSRPLDAHNFNSALLNSAQLTGSPLLWHSQLGHPCNNVLSHVLRTCNIPVKRNSLPQVCSSCQLGKAHKLPFDHSTTMYSSPFELVVSDVWGPAHVNSNGFSYYVSFVDMHSRYTWLYFLKAKSEVFKCFIHFYHMVKVQFGSSIRMLQSEGGGEYRALSGKLSRLGIQHRISCPHTSEQNGVAERKHRQVVDMGLTLLAQASIPLQFWSYAFAHAVHLSNRLPTPILQQCSPYEKFYNLKPSYSQLKVFGNQKGYKCLDADGRIFISRHVVFDESCYLFATGFCPCSLLASIQFDHQQLHLPRVLPPSASTLGFSYPPRAESPPGSCGSNLPFSSSGLHGGTSPTVCAPSLVSPSAAPSPALIPVNAYPMQTRSKSGIHKPKVFSSVLTEKEPTNILEAFQSPAWTAAAQAEYNALLSNGTWDLVPLPEGRRAVGCKWIFRIKRHADGSVARYKGQLVETFSPVVKPTTIRVVLTLVVSFGWALRQVDINNAFLNGDLHEEIYIVQPPGFEQQGVSGQQLVCRLRKALYGLKQAPRAWFHKLKEFLLVSNFTASKADNSLFICHSGSTLVYVLIYVDDIIITGNNSQAIDRFVHDLNARFSLKDLGQLNYFLGIQVTYDKGGVFLSQKKYILELLQKASMDRSKSTPTPMTTTCKLTTTEGSPVEDEHLYRSIVGGLQYVVITRPEIAFSVNKVCQFMHRPLDSHFRAVKRILRYLQGTLDYGLQFSPSKFLLEGFSDASWGSDTDDRGNLISWSSRKQQVVSRSTAEAEYRSLAHVTAEMVWIQSLISELSAPKTKALVWCNSVAAVAVAGNPVMHSKFKHVELDLFFVREKVANGVLQVGHISSQDQIADILTKPLSEGMFTKFRAQLQVVSNTLNIQEEKKDRGML
ncbi:hypothetical protein CXB51_016682 [Gossypium anomalum]|uniref:Integrase catalytic domain-containing protein n=1 Tax=Gossypium anomalum TaxID=47600 RepID=A0A8J6CYX3_9ROSI|nr:hypothetical protein CXB51_016682 [Gossypium anomalum]